MDLYESRADLAAKIDWEGGVEESISYGIRAEHFPVDTPKEILDAWNRLVESYQDVDLVSEWLQAS
jgi:hypothetical protein